MNGIQGRYRATDRRLLLLDYDGTLADIAPTPEQAKPTKAIIDVLKLLTTDPNNTVVIISGRSPEILEKWLSGTGVNIVAEHGHFIKEGSGPWHKGTAKDDSWKSAVRKHMSDASDAVSNSFIEEKNTSLVWHYRRADQTKGERVADSLLHTLQSLPDIHVTKGSKIIEARQPGADKGQAAKYWISKGSFDFILAAGDDVTDEDLFSDLPKGSYSIKIGNGDTKANLRLDSPEEFRSLLRSFYL